MRALSRSEFSRGHAAGVRPHLGIVAAKSHDFIGTLIVSGIQMVEAITRNEQGHVGSPHTHTPSAVPRWSIEIQIHGLSMGGVLMPTSFATLICCLLMMKTQLWFAE